MAAPKQPRSARKLTRNDWLSAALAALLSAGPEGVHVEPLAASLGVTKGSFYWHFEDLQDLLSSVIDYWATRMLGAVRDHDNLTGSPAQNLLEVMEDIAREDRARYEAAMRTWAKSDERAKQAVRRVDQARLEWTTGVFREMGFSPEQAEIRGRMMVLYEYGDAEFSIRASLEQRLAWVKLRHEILTSGGP
ncbi:MAG: TetR/AcrR family transcriptional regulator [Gemmatimonadales bacterium]|jgi:AcrR family transcriptional regulator